MRDQTITNGAAWMYIGFFLAIVCNVAVFLLWRFLPDIFQDNPIDHYVGSHKHCKPIACSKAPNPLRPRKRL